MKKSALFTFFLAAGLITAVIPVRAETELFRHGSRLGFSFSAPVTIRSRPVESCRLILYYGPFAQAETVTMQNGDAVWRAYITVEDTSVKALFYAFELTVAGSIQGPYFSKGDYGCLLAADETGHILRGAYQQLALSYTGAGSLKRKDLQKAQEAIQNELQRYPRNFEARRLWYTIRFNAEGNTTLAKAGIARDIETLISTGPADLEVLRFAVSAFKMIGETEKADEVNQKIVSSFPRSDTAAEIRINEIIAEKDAGARAEKLESYISTYKDSSGSGIALAALASAAIELNDQQRMIAAGDRLVQSAFGPSAAGALAGLAGVLGENNVQQEKAESYALRAVELIRDAAEYPRPPEMTAMEWEEQLLNSEARYRDILGWIRVQRGDLAAGLKELQFAAETISEPGIYLHLGSAHERLGHSEDALTAYARGAVFDGEIGDMAYNAFMTLWKDEGRTDAGAEMFLDQQGDFIENRFKAKVLSRRISTPAPDFELEDITSGDVIRLSDQKGVPIVLCFWSAFSRSSHYLLKDLNEIADMYGQDVLFMTISTDTDMNRLLAYLNRFEMNFPVLLSNGTDQAYGLRGVPMLFVIDKSLAINFRHRGYRPDLKETLVVELDELLIHP